MRRLLIPAALAVFALAPVGCNKSPEGGTPGTANSFQLDLPVIPNAIKQGDTETVKIKVDRGKDFKGAVKLSAKAPDKITAEFDRTTVKDGESQEVNLSIKPAADAPAGDHKVTITGTPESGSATSKDLTVKVVAK
ncbi:MAG: hypothetical protein K2X87_34870 [Gemmataceae bacterium]|nr:hypothetical protein [Gemmataceae bacterium]